jgi:TolA-binding protein
MGELEFSRGHYVKAIKWGKRALTEKPSKDLYLLLGKVYYKLGNCKEAKYYFLKVINGSDIDNPAALKGLELCS